MAEPYRRTDKVVFPGDEVRMVLTFTHNDNIDAVEVVYAHAEDPLTTLVLSGNPEPEEDSPEVGIKKRSQVALSEQVDIKHQPGDYHVQRVLFYTFCGNVLRYSTSEMTVEHSTLSVFEEDGSITNMQLSTDEDTSD